MQTNNTTAIITGGASGLGAATARLFIEKGIKVAIIDTNLYKAELFAEEIGAKAYCCDVSSENEVNATLKKIILDLGTPRILVNCAGIATPAKIVGKQGVMPLDFFQHIINVNLFGTFNMLRLCAEKMMSLDVLEDDQRGVIISTASIAAFEGQIGQSAYAASKGAIVSLTLPAAREFAAFGIRVNSIAPGVFMTPLVANLPKEVQENLALSIPNPKRLGMPEEFAKLVLHIVENNYINGETIRLDGALRMQSK
jgi:NAD(P)-dependent dehydrogenase (short-subunit alcohol dehydrogenase family)